MHRTRIRTSAPLNSIKDLSPPTIFINDATANGADISNSISLHRKLIQAHFRRR